MALGPILPGRIPSALLASRLQQNIDSQQRGLTELMDQVSTGQRFQQPNEAPVAAAQTMVLQRLLERQEHFKATVATDQSLLAATETAMSSVGEAMNRAVAISLQGTGDQSTALEKQALAAEVGAIVTQVMQAANTNFRGRHLFAGSLSQSSPFEATDSGFVRYLGDEFQVQSNLLADFQIGNNIDGNTAFAAITEPVGADVDPALTLQTRLQDLNGGLGVELGMIQVTLDNGVPQSQTVDLSSAETIEDLKTQLEAAFATGPLTLTVDIDPLTNFGLQLTSSAGTVAVADVAGGRMAQDLGINSTAAATINGSDLDPNLTELTPLAALNAGTGIGVTAGNGLLISNGLTTQVVDISTAVTVEDLFNVLRVADSDLAMNINQQQNGLAISSRLSGANFSIGENGGENATALGIRTLVTSSQLRDLNLGGGVPVDDGVNLEITLRDATTASLDLSGMTTVDQVLNAINAVPGLDASLNDVGNGVTITDVTGGLGDLIVHTNQVSEALGIDGTVTGPGPLIGEDVNPRQATGIISILVNLQMSLESGDDNELARLVDLLDVESERFNLVRGEVATRLQVTESVEQSIVDEELLLTEARSDVFDADLTQSITEMAHAQQAFQVTLEIAARSMQLNLMSYL